MQVESVTSLANEVRTLRERVATRLRELEPLAREYQELLALAGELGIETPELIPTPGKGASGAPDASGSAPTRPRRRSGGSSGPSAGGGARRAAGRNPHRDAALLEALRAKPGTTIAELATVLGVPTTSLYRTVRELTSSGAVVKRGRGLYVED